VKSKSLFVRSTWGTLRFIWHTTGHFVRRVRYGTLDLEFFSFHGRLYVAMIDGAFA
jgi:hypothetical protein